MSSHVKFITLCLLSLAVAACSSRSINAPIDGRSHDAHSRPTSTVKPGPAKAGRASSTSSVFSYVVRSGDTLYSVARKYNMGYWQLANINGIRPPFTIYEGQRLKLRGETTTAAAAAPRPEAGKPGAEAKPKPKPKPKARPKSKPVPQAAAKKVEKPAAAKTGVMLEFDGKWQWPTRGRLLRGYKPDEPGKKGIYIGGHRGQPVKAAAIGKVVYVGSGLVGYGRLIIIRHNENLLSTYGHNSELLVAEGEYVKAGQVIAKMGSSGTGRTELYFEIRKDGKPVNPLKYLPGKH